MATKMTTADMAEHVSQRHNICFAEAVDEVCDAIDLIGSADYPQEVFAYIDEQYATNRTRL